MNLYRMKGVYCILNTLNGKIYIGSTLDSFGSRWKSHKGKLNRQVHPNTHLQAAWNKHGSAAFVFDVLYESEIDAEIVEKEQFFLDIFFGPICYNIRAVAKSNKGYKIKDTSRIKTANAEIRSRGDYRDNLSKAQKLRYSDPQTRKQQSERVKLAYKNPDALHRKSEGAQKTYNITLIDPNGQEYFIERGLHSFCDQHGLHRGTIYQLIKGTAIARTCKGWKVKK